MTNQNAKLWDKGYGTDQEIERFTVGRDREMDMYLAEADVLGSLAHIRMLEEIGLLTAAGLRTLTAELQNIYAQKRFIPAEAEMIRCWWT